MALPMKQLVTGYRNRGISRLFSSTVDYLTPLPSSQEQVFAISGSSRGIGLEFSRQLLLRTEETKVIGLARTSSPALLELQAQFPDRLNVVHVDLEDQQSVEAAGKEISGLASRVDVLLNVAGILGDGGKNFPGPERSIANIDRAWFSKTLELNCVGHVMMTQALLPLLKRDKKSSPSKIVNLSARVGSINDNSLGGWYSYRISKTGLNMFTKTSSIELKRYNSMVMSIHPGTTDTDLSVPFQKNVKTDMLFTTEKSCGLMLNVIFNADMEQTGKFFAYDGSEIAW
eukprot:CAMPEP_0119051366 /NCGR_PEP_ID=MMETSP1177-20130426/73010_1 /TAXON_ID=2985 /ORGANISM="Ochromonas sp, Strain CCMP1899" /LENGTH=285 /DNA_ID=CAMNT_0007030551 /DNA_START=135 /DNA_END=992 /DNA_ORIENTATION=+